LDLGQWRQIDEAIHVAATDEEYKKYAGINNNEKLIERLAELKLYNSEIFINTFSNPRTLVLGSIEDIAYSKTKKLELELHNTRNTKIVSATHKFNGSYVNWSTWRQFNSLEKNHLDRKEVFDEFITKTKFISSIVEARFSLIKQVYQEYQRIKDVLGNNLSPLSGYLENERISNNQLTEFIKSMGDRAKKSFRDELSNISKKILGREPEYYDDFYFFRNRAFSDMEANFLAVNPLLEVKRILEFMEFDINKIHFDTDDRKNKHPSPICFFVRIPDDIRILYKKESPYFDLQGCFHETGHAIHANSIGKNNEYWDKYRIPMGIEEIFSIFLERVTKNSYYIRSLFSSSNMDINRIVNELESRNKFMELFFVTFYTANSLMKLEYWNKNLTVNKASDVYSRLIKEYMGFEIPGEYWLLHHILPESIMYVPSYLLAAVRAAELDHHMQNTFGDKWWTESGAGRALRAIMESGAKVDLSEFSKLDSNVFLKDVM
jgi:Peptidase family M3